MSEVPDEEAIEEAAREELGHDHLRPGQLEGVEAALEGRDTLVVMATGRGKSAIYQLAGFFRDGPTVVVSPLIALQRDQVEQAEGGEAAELNSTLTHARARRSSRGRASGATEFVLLAPEQLANPDVLGAPARHAAVAVRRRRGALRVAVGPRLPARLPGAGRGRRGARAARRSSR